MGNVTVVAKVPLYEKGMRDAGDSFAVNEKRAWQLRSLVILPKGFKGPEKNKMLSGAPIEKVAENITPAAPVGQAPPVVPEIAPLLKKDGSPRKARGSLGE